MFYTIGLLVVALVFALCRAQERQMDSDLRFLIESQRILAEARHG